MRVHVVGAGPAGSVAAISALRENHNVSLYEEHSHAGLPVNCSGLISKEGLESLKEFVDYRKHIISKMRGAVIDCAGSQLIVDSKKDIAYTINRASFDEALAQKAEEEGAKTYYNKRASAPFPDGHIIGADGPNSIVASHFNFPKIERFAGISQAAIKYDGPMPGYVRIFLSNEKYPGFFAWLIPKNEEYAEVAAGCVLPENPNKALDFLAKELGREFPKERTHSIIPVAQRERTSAFSQSRNILLVGDAAGQVKSTTGGGIVFGTGCAKIAGRNINTPKQYEREWRATYGKELDTHCRLHKVLGTLNDDSLRAFASIASTFKIEEFLQRNGNMDNPTKMLGPNLFLHSIRSFVKK